VTVTVTNWVTMLLILSLLILTVQCQDPIEGVTETVTLGDNVKVSQVVPQEGPLELRPRGERADGPLPPRLRQRPTRPQGSGFGSFLSGLLGSMTQTAKVDACPGKCIHALASLICDEVLEEVQCPTSSMRCCVEKEKGGVPAKSGDSDMVSLGGLNFDLDMPPNPDDEDEDDEEKGKENSSMEKDETTKKKKKKKRKKNRTTTTTTTTTTTKKTKSTTKKTTPKPKKTTDSEDEDDYEEEYEYTSPAANTSDTSRFHQHVFVSLITSSVLTFSHLSRTSM